MASAILPTMFQRSRSCSLRLLWLVLSGSGLASAGAFEWDVQRFEGRDYVTLESIAEFYGLPAPPSLVPAPIVGPVPQGEPEGALGMSPPVPDIHLETPATQVKVTLNSREVMLNGVKQWLAFPVHLQADRALVSRLDVAKVIEPRLRPEKIAGLGPVETVVIDAGHGGHDRGARSRFGYEKDFALDVALRVRELLEKQRYKVVMTRSSDIFIPLEQRAEVANRIPNSIFVSVHFNSSSSNADARGFEIFSIAPRGAPATNDATLSERNLREEPGNVTDVSSTALAGTVYNALLGKIPNVDRGLKHARFAVLRRCTVPAVLVECGFVSNSAESALIGSSAWRRQLAEAIVDGVDNYKGLAERKQRPKVLADYRRITGGNP